MIKVLELRLVFFNYSSWVHSHLWIPISSTALDFDPSKRAQFNGRVMAVFFPASTTQWKRIWWGNIFFVLDNIIEYLGVRKLQDVVRRHQLERWKTVRLHRKLSTETYTFPRQDWRFEDKVFVCSKQTKTLLLKKGTAVIKIKIPAYQLLWQLH